MDYMTHPMSLNDTRITALLYLSKNRHVGYTGYRLEKECNIPLRTGSNILKWLHRCMLVDKKGDKYQISKRGISFIEPIQLNRSLILIVNAGDRLIQSFRKSVRKIYQGETNSLISTLPRSLKVSNTSKPLLQPLALTKSFGILKKNRPCVSCNFTIKPL